MKSFALMLVMMFGAGTLSAHLFSAKWGTNPTAPVYAGQAYELTLTLETLANEEIAGVRMEQGPNRQPDQQTTYQKGDRRFTVLHWQQSDPRAKVASIPAGRIQANVTQVQVFGFMRTANTTQQIAIANAFSYEVQELPGDARGLPIGAFTLTLSADQNFFAPGEVRLLTAKLTAQEGYVPDDYEFALEETSSGELYPFRVQTKTARELVAQAHFVVAAEQDVTLCLKSLRLFDLKSRTVAEVQCESLTLQMRPLEDLITEDTTLAVSQATATRQGAPLRFAPSIGAPVVGALEAPWQVEETREQWSRVKTPQGAGWIRSELLKEEMP